jgi:hypothetical protein
MPSGGGSTEQANRRISMLNKEKIVNIAYTCHAANTAWCEVNKDPVLSWEQCRESAVKGVEFLLTNPGAPASAQHNAWMADKTADGWKFGLVKDAEKKEHPCLVPFDQLPDWQQAKDRLFQSIVHALTS